MTAVQPPRESAATAGRLWPSAEQQLLLTAALERGDEAIDAFRAWRARVDIDAEFGWQSLRLMPLVYQNLARLSVNDPLMTRLKGVYRRAWYETHQLFQRTRPAVAALVQSGIDVLLLKGAPLALAYHQNHAVRPMSDVDVLVRTPDATRAIEILTGLGWRPTSPPSPDRLRFFHALQFVHPEGGEIDLHWHVMFESCAGGRDDAFWADTEPLDFLGIPVRQLGPTMALLQQVVHGVRWNLETPIRWIPDSLAILERRADDIDWSRIHAVAQELRVTHRLGLGFRYLIAHFGAAIPLASLREAEQVPLSFTERWENSVILRDTLAVQARMLGNQWTILADLARIVDPARRPLQFLVTYPHYLRYRLGLEGRREIPGIFLRGFVRRAQRLVPAPER